jgi:hypothetical protein
LLAVLAGAETFVDIARFGQKKIAFLRRFLPFRDGTPSHDHLGDIFATLDATEFQRPTVIHDVAWLQERHQWPGLQGVVVWRKSRPDSRGKGRKQIRLHRCCTSKSIAAKGGAAGCVPPPIFFSASSQE